MHLGDYRVVELTNPHYRLPEVSSTFHGRDIFSPAAAHLASGVPLKDLGPAVDTLVLLDPPRLWVEADHIEAEVLNVDHFGNLRTSIHTLAWEDDTTLSLRPIFEANDERSPAVYFSTESAHVSDGQLRIKGISTTFSTVQPGQPLAYIGSEGGLEITINQANAAREFSVKPGDPVRLNF